MDNVKITEDLFRNFIRANHLTKKWEDYLSSVANINDKPTEDEDGLVEYGFVDIPEPIGNFIIKSDVKGIMRADGMYYHYADVCNLLKLYKNYKSK